MLHGADIRSFLVFLPTAMTIAMSLMTLTDIFITTVLASIHVAMMGMGMPKHCHPSSMLPTHIPCPSRRYLFRRHKVCVGSHKQVYKYPKED